MKKGNRMCYNDLTSIPNYNSARKLPKFAELNFRVHVHLGFRENATLFDSVDENNFVCYLYNSG